ncbi:hypothetical protein [Paracoccus hibiscisoli]|uniref:Uncharacterized protein n=1 Tax=Paracoccus hibiscisoli TaxID=2023261 RepID=A0A4U0QTX7_9RHOB|nr:hypothetical protein [Paracoccus hibiscisoli]TJZ84882.1 hypothetical protein FA740_07960 [Paracoccus hibiscisoli]
MRGDVMQWMGRLVAVVFGLGVLALIGAVVVLIRQAEGVPPMPVFLGLLGMTVLILLAGACLALISIAVSARRGVEALRGMGGAAPMAVAEEEAEPEMQGPPFTSTGLAEAIAPPRPPRPGRVLVAER